MKNFVVTNFLCLKEVILKIKVLNRKKVMVFIILDDFEVIKII